MNPADVEAVEVTQDDRDAAGDYARLLLASGKNYRENVCLSAFMYRNGEQDGSALTKAFARHRITALCAAVEEARIEGVKAGLEAAASRLDRLEPNKAAIIRAIDPKQIAESANCSATVGGGA